MIYSPRQLEEKLTLFWHMHFATSFAKVPLVPLMYAQNQIFRAMAMAASSICSWLCRAIRPC